MATPARLMAVIASAATRPPELKVVEGPAHMEFRDEWSIITSVSPSPARAGTVAQAIEARARSRHGPTVCGIPTGCSRAARAPAKRLTTAR